MLSSFDRIMMGLDRSIIVYQRTNILEWVLIKHNLNEVHKTLCLLLAKYFFVQVHFWLFHFLFYTFFKINALSIGRIMFLSLSSQVR